MELWKDLSSEFPHYQVSNLGNLRTFRNKNGRGLSNNPRPLIPRLCTDKPYLRVTLTNILGKQVTKLVHLLVLETFVKRPSDKHQTCHSDGNSFNNNLDNLRWGLIQDNANDRIKHGTQVRGTQVHLTKLTEEQVLELKEALPNWSKGMGNLFSKKFGVSPSTISAIKNNLTWKHL